MFVEFCREPVDAFGGVNPVGAPAVLFEELPPDDEPAVLFEESPPGAEPPVEVVLSEPGDPGIPEDPGGRGALELLLD